MTSLQDRPAAGLYVAAWLLSGVGLGLLILALQAGPPLRGVLLMIALALLIVGLAAGAGYQIVSRRTRPAQAFSGPSPLLLLGLQFVVVNTISLVLLLIGVPGTDSPIGFFIAAALLLAAYVGVVWLFGIRSGALTWRGIGLPDRPSLGRLLGDIGVGGGFLLVVAVTASLLGGLLARFLDTSAPEVVPPPDTPAGILLVALGAVVLLPIGEELFFRGYSLTAWRQDMGERSALLRSTLFFALVHIGTLTSSTFEAGARQALLVVVVIAPVGYALGWLFLRRGLVAAIAGHAAFNGFAILVTVLAPHLPPPGT